MIYGSEADKAYNRSYTGGIGSAAPVAGGENSLNQLTKSDTINGMIDLLNHPLSELQNALHRLSMLNDRILGPRPAELPQTAGEAKKEHPSMAFRFADKHSEFSRLTSAIHAEITKLDQVL